jgi:catechol 2,3-dioxygenase-like lactoylglutathione lyase family enzyme
MNPTIDVINLGVRELDSARNFYEHVLGGAAREESDHLTVSFAGNASPLTLRPWEAVASDAGVEAQSSGFRAFTLSYILESADDVDEILARAERHGASISKPPKNALWGYSAYLTDPSGYQWKIASSKRRPLIGRKDAANGSGHPAQAQEVPITIGVADMNRAKEFYRDGLGLPVKKDYRKFVMFSGGGDTSDLGMYKREALADDAAVDPAGSGFHGFSITHLVESTAHVRQLLAQAADAGGQIVKPAVGGAGGRYGGYFADPDGNLWQVATGN